VARNPIPLIVMAVVGVFAMQSPKIAQQWERAIVLRLGKFIGLQGPGLFWIVPFVDSVSSWIDQRTITTSFAAEQTLTSDTVPINVDAVLFWMVYDAQKAASSAVESMGMGGLMGAAALAQQKLTGGGDQTDK
jgi:regulator of protease activity HflC (stomatin/prohibitin superfamily)